MDTEATCGAVGVIDVAWGAGEVGAVVDDGATRGQAV
jgi:hypothetical protein